jgi:hypothetical protein
MLGSLGTILHIIYYGYLKVSTRSLSVVCRFAVLYLLDDYVVPVLSTVSMLQYLLRAFTQKE